jgi:hypothetical protein
MLQMYVANVSPISNVCCKCFIWILHMLQTYDSIVSHGFTMLQHVLLPTRSDSWHAHAARAHPAPLISVIRASSNSRICAQRAVNAQMTEHCLVKVHAHTERQSQPTPNGPCTTTGTDAMLPSSLVCSWTGSTHMLLPLGASHPIVRTELMSFIGSLP